MGKNSKLRRQNVVGGGRVVPLQRAQAQAPDVAPAAGAPGQSRKRVPLDEKQQLAFQLVAARETVKQKNTLIARLVARHAERVRQLEADNSELTSQLSKAWSDIESAENKTLLSRSGLPDNATFKRDEFGSYYYEVDDKGQPVMEDAQGRQVQTPNQKPAPTAPKAKAPAPTAPPAPTPGETDDDRDDLDDEDGLEEDDLDAEVAEAVAGAGEKQ